MKSRNLDIEIYVQDFEKYKNTGKNKINQYKVNYLVKILKIELRRIVSMLNFSIF